MKNSILTFLCFTLPFFCFSQIEFNVGAGVNFNTSSILQNSPEATDEATITGLLHGDILFQKNKIGLRTSLQLESIQWKEGFSRQDETTNSTLVYLNLSPQLEFKPKDFFSVSAGGYAKLMIIESINSAFFDQLSIFPPFNFFKGYDAGLAGGVNYFHKRWTFRLQYLHGLVNVSDDITLTNQNGEAIGQKEQYNRILQLTGTYRL